MGEKASQTAVLDLLSRKMPVDALSHLIGALQHKTPDIDNFSEWAIGFDANVLLNLAKGRRGADLIDYLRSVHRGPVILPSQAVQEFWNSRIYSVSGLADNVRSNFTSLENLVNQIDPAFSGFKTKLEPILREFESEFGHVLDERTAGEIDALLAALEECSLRAEVDRSSLYPIARQRKLAKTPPGFKDEGDGDFLIWADFLLCLQMAMDERPEFPAAALVTDDTKKDWSTKGTPNPILTAEVHTLVGVPFFTLTLTQFNSRVEKELAARVDS
ncbi:MAG: PIN-like domain-containing protein [Schaalia hyovaginalis]|uniref:PIN-like domain-containing protein n=1 Tax=Schaalia hyovaginalis TaxID=29316 RepID=UPI002A7EC6B8|nr:PIN-like domain-containing protein [Schaalia hyovaginalis]MDY3666484.1 PIN-like domain-containing protein [Schaalia hyovaginalis]MDY6214825.1 PIN-like domain-containing protein [Schaalia hyovaginalis]